MSRDNNSIFESDELPEKKEHNNKFESDANVGSDIEWSVPAESVPLPSMGLIYEKQSYFHNKETVNIKSMTAKEEDILLSPAYYKTGTVMNELIRSCIGVPGVDPDDLIPGDKNALIVSIRITGYGSIYPVKITCGHCNHVDSVDYDLSNVGIKRLGAEPVENGLNQFRYQLPISKKNVIFKILNGREDKAREREVELIQEKVGGNSAGLITSILHHSIVSVDGVTDKNKIRKFVNNMPALDSKRLREYMTSIQPGIDTDIDHKCSNCGQLTTVRLPIGGKFFFPD